VVVGTYSSIYIAANVMILMKISKEDLAIPVKEGAEDPDMMG
jgi:preprotein translocase subunit SecF